jgi:hypothetical protein
MFQPFLVLEWLALALKKLNFIPKQPQTQTPQVFNGKKDDLSWSIKSKVA